MKELLKFFLFAIIIIVPIYMIIVKSIFKNSILTKFGYVSIILSMSITIVTLIIEKLNIPSVIGIVIRLLFVLIAILVLKRDIKIIENISKNLKNISEFDLSTLIDEKNINRKDELGDLTKSLKIMKQQLIMIVEKLQENSATVLGAGNQLSDSSQKISQRANEQAATTEEISSSIEEMLATIQSNTEKSENTSRISVESARKMEQNKGLIIKTLESISDISKKITVISEIADKTDILSINAAIEAARAGEAGRGFTIVAQEIRKLADKTQLAAQEINELSKNNITISQISKKQFEKVIPIITEASKQINSIAIANKEQENNISSINNAVILLTETTNENSASAEEMASYAEELTAQAEQLKQLIGIFKIENLKS